MKDRSKLIMVLLILAPLRAFSQPTVEFVRGFDYGQRESFQDIYRVSSGGFIACGAITAAENNRTAGDILIVRTNEEGREIWHKTFPVENNIGEAKSIIELDGGDFVFGGVRNRLFTAARIDSEGDTVWWNDYNGSACNALIELKNDNIMMCGKNGGGAGCIILINSDGEVIWSVSHSPGQRYANFTSMRETDDGVVLCGSTDARLWIAKTQLDNGDLIWSNQYDLGNATYGYGLVSSGDGGFVATGYAQSSIIFALKVDQNGREVWHNVMDREVDYGEAYGIQRLADGGFICVGVHGMGHQQPIVVKIDSQGHLIWTNEYSWDNDELYRSPGYFTSVVTGNDEAIYMSGFAQSRLGESLNALIVKMSSDVIGNANINISPEDTAFSVLPDSTIDFAIDIENQELLDQVEFTWTYNDSLISNSNSIRQNFPSLGQQIITCLLRQDELTIRIPWHVTVTDLYISAFTPDTLDLTLRRGSSVDFSIDTVRYVDGAEPEYLWTVTNLDNNEQSHPGAEAGATITFNQSGSYSVEGLAYRGESSDAVTWNVQVRGAIWAYAPEELAFEMLPDSLVQFDVLPTVPDAEGQTIHWLVDGEMVAEDTTLLQWSFGSVDNFPRYLAQVQVVVADTVESDTVSWEVTVREPDAVDDKRDGYPTRMELLSVSPNPFNSMLTIRYSGGLETAATRLAVYDLSGRVVNEIASPARTGDFNRRPQINSVVWDASSIPAGVYFVRLQSGREIITKKVVLMK